MIPCKCKTCLSLFQVQVTQLLLEPFSTRCTTSADTILVSLGSGQDNLFMLHTILRIMGRLLVVDTTSAHVVAVGTPHVVTPMPFPQGILHVVHARGWLEDTLSL